MDKNWSILNSMAVVHGKVSLIDVLHVEKQSLPAFCTKIVHYLHGDRALVWMQSPLDTVPLHTNKRCLQKLHKAKDLESPTNKTIFPCESSWGASQACSLWNILVSLHSKLLI